MRTALRCFGGTGPGEMSPSASDESLRDFCVPVAAMDADLTGLAPLRTLAPSHSSQPTHQALLFMSRKIRYGMVAG
ncbi:hypothetical protein, partial [Prosthecobacter sp.]